MRDDDAMVNDDVERVLQLILIKLEEGMSTGGEMPSDEVEQLSNSYAAIKGAESPA